MTNRKNIGVIALIAGLALMLGACGSKTSTTTSTDTAQVTFNSVPSAEIWIDGKTNGTTPTVVALPAGTHEVTLKREGFVDVSQKIDVEAGKDITITGDLPVAGEDANAFRRLVAMIGDEHEPLAKPTTHRGAGDAVTIYYPRGDVRRAALNTYRIEVDPSYDYEGFIEFKKGTKVLWREKFEPEALITERALPAEVLEASRNGAKLTWGLTYDNKRAAKDKNKTVKFKIISKSREKKIAKSLDKLQKRKPFKTATPLMQEMAEADHLKRYRLYSEVLVRSLGILNGWSETELPYANMVDVMTRLKLKESSLYQFASSKVSGAGGMRIVKGGTKTVTEKRRTPSDFARKEIKKGEQDDLTDLDRTVQQGSLPPIAVAPPAERSGKTAQPGGMGVQPTDKGSASQDPAAAATGGDEQQPGSDTSTSGNGRNPYAERFRQMDNEIEQVKEKLREVELRAAKVAEAEGRVTEINEALAALPSEIEAAQQAQEGLDNDAAAATKALEDLEASGTATQQQIDDARHAATEAQQAAAEGQSNLERLNNMSTELEQAKKDAEDKVRKITKSVGNGGDIQAEAQGLRERLETLENNRDKLSKEANEAGFSSSGDPAGTADSQVPGQKPDAAQRQMDREEERKNRFAEFQAQAKQDYANAQNALAEAQNFLKDVTDEAKRASEALDQATQAYDAIANGTLPSAKQDYETKTKAYDDLVAAGAPQTDIDNALAAAEAAKDVFDAETAKLEQAEADRAREEANTARADMEQQRAEAAQDRAQQDLVDAENDMSIADPQAWQEKVEREKAAEADATK